MKRLLMALVALLMVGCGGGGSHGPTGNQYLTACYTDENNVVFVDIFLPFDYIGVFSETTVPSFGEIVSESATYNLGVFEPGDYVFELELIAGSSPGMFGSFLDGYIEVCLLTVGELPVDPPPDDPPLVDPPVIDPPPVLPPAWGLHKILVCHDGEQKFLPYPAASNLIRDGKATFGVCPIEE